MRAGVGAGVSAMDDPRPGLSPMRVRLVVFLALGLIALAAIWLIDERAMIRMHELGTGYTTPATAIEP